MFGTKLCALVAAFFAIVVGDAYAQTARDSAALRYRVAKPAATPYEPVRPASNIGLKDPSNFTNEVEYDEETDQYIIHQKVGGVDVRPPFTMSREEYGDYDVNSSLKNYWRQRYRNESFERQGGSLTKFNVDNELFETIFGSSVIDIKPQGTASLKFGLKITNTANPNIAQSLRRQTIFDFKENIQMSVAGKIGDNLEMKISYDTESQFDFDNTINLKFQGKEDDIIQKIEAGNVSLPLSTSLITGSQSLFGVLTELKFGKLYVSTVISQQKGESKTITTQGGAQVSQFDVSAVDYDKNRHFFLSHYFRSQYDKALKHLPLIVSSVQITKVEVWVTNTKRSTENAHNIVAFMDLGEEREEYPMYNRKDRAVLNPEISFLSSPAPDNNANSLYQKILSVPNVRDIDQVTKSLSDEGFAGARDYEKVEYARKLNSNEYTINTQLGYITLNSALNGDEILAVAFEYTVDGVSYKVGEFTSDGIANPSNLIVKLLKGSNFTPKYPNWDLMMKNVYSLDAYQLNSEDFVLEVEYYNNKSRVRKLSNAFLNDEIKNTKLLNLMGLDNLNSKNDYVKGGNGMFDFVPGVTVNTTNGRVYFPVVEPFGGHLHDTLGGDLPSKDFVFQELYDSTQYKAQQMTAKSKFYLKGSYKSSGGSEISLNSFNIPQGSVVVTAGGITLTENVDYTVDYNMGRVKIINESYLVSGTPIKVSLESNSTFSLMEKTLLGTHLDYRFSDRFNLGATVMHLNEKPTTTKVNVGEDPISNTIWGLNGSYEVDLPMLTKFLDWLPLIETKEKSTMSVQGEYAQLVPGHNRRAVGKSGEVYIDDFESSESSYDMTNREAWTLASIPQGNIFREASTFNNLETGYNRAKIAWYKIDPLMFQASSPVSKAEQSRLNAYRVPELNIYPNRDQSSGDAIYLTTFDVTFDPTQRGPYNYSTDDYDRTGRFRNPQDKWGGIMRETTTKNFETSNIEYLEFWMMDPFVEEDSLNPGGQLYFNFGNISEDVLKDSRKSYENGLPTTYPPDPTSYDETVWGRVPAVQKSNISFVNEESQRRYQDVGLDGLSSTSFSGGPSDEQQFFSSYLDKLESVLDADVFREFRADPSGDDYHYFKGSDYDEAGYGIVDRYMNYNNPEGNSPVSTGATSTYATSKPDVEDINGDYTLSEGESYFQYRVDLNHDNMMVGSNYIVDERNVTNTMPNGERKSVKWYLFRIPLNTRARQQIGDIEDFTSIRFMRMFLHGWQQKVVLRFATLDLVKGDWFTYDYDLKAGNEALLSNNENNDESASAFSISTVNIEENGSRAPVNYLLPVGVTREQDPSQTQLVELNEQSMTMKVVGLGDGYSKAVYKTVNVDMRNYEKIKMFIHAEAVDDESSLSDDEVTCFIRIGQDYTENYYEYEVPLKVTPWWTSRPYPDNNDNRRLVWPEDNNMEVIFSELVDAKLERNAEIKSGNPSVSQTMPYVVTTGSGRNKRKITVMGNPNIAIVKSLMIGVRNPQRKDNVFTSDDDGQEKSAEIWVNELRLTDFNESGGWAAQGAMNIKMADLGNVNVAGSTTQAGFGSIEQSTSERSMEQTNSVDVAANIELGKLFPKEANVRIPMFMSYSRMAVNPEYNPFDPDVKIKEGTKGLSRSDRRDYLDGVQDLTERRSISFTNVGVGQRTKKKQTSKAEEENLTERQKKRKEKKSKNANKTHFYSPSNLSASYAYVEEKHSDYSVKYDNTTTHSGSLNYTFNNQPKAIEPFKKSKLLKKPYLRIIGDVNFYLTPAQIAWRTGVKREYNETLLRNISLGMTSGGEEYTPTCDKSFDWEREFSIKYNLSKGIKFTWMMNTMTVIEEPEGLIDKTNRTEYEQFKKDVWESILEGGLAKEHNQKFTASYTVPINKIPLLNWTSLTARYASTYQWDRAPQVEDSSLYVGNTIGNTNQININVQGNLDNLYNKIKPIESLQKKYKQTREKRLAEKQETVTSTIKGFKAKKGASKTVSHNLRTEEAITVKVTAGGKDVRSRFEILNENRVKVTVDEDVEDAEVVVTGSRTVSDSPALRVMEGVALAVIGLKNVSFAYTESNAMTLEGYRPEYNFSELRKTPGLPFIFGYQDTAFAEREARRGHLIDNINLIQPFLTSNQRRVDIKATYQPIKALKIDFTGQRTITRKTSEYYLVGNYDAKHDEYDVYRSTRMESGAYNVTVWTLKTAFGDRPTEKNTQSEAFNEYRRNLHKFAWEQANQRLGHEPNYFGAYEPVGESDSIMPAGYSISNPDIAVPAFLAAYTGQNNGIDFTSWKNFRPGWKLKYDGLTAYKPISKRVKSVSLSHGYQSTFSVGSFMSSKDYNYEQARMPEYGNMSWAVADVGGYGLFVPYYDITSFSITEAFSPLFGVDVTWLNSLSSRLEYKRSRTMTMNLTNSQMLELYKREYVLGAGYRIQELVLPFKNRKGDQFVSDCNLRADLTISDNITVTRDLVLNDNEITSGQLGLAMSMSAEYELNDKVTLRLYYDYDLMSPKTTNSYRNTTTEFGFELKFSLSKL